MIPAAVILPLLLLQAGDSPESLLERLRTEDPAARRQAQMALLRQGAPAVTGLLLALETASPRPEEEIAALIRRLGSPAWKERNAATQALVRLGRAAVPSLEAQLAYADPEVAWRIRASVAEIREKAGQDEQAEELRAAAICDVLGQAGDRRAVAPLLRLLAADPPAKRTALKVRACQALGLLRASMTEAQTGEAADHVVQVLERVPSPLDKGILIQTLGVLGAANAVRPLAALLADRSEKNVHLKRSCASALAAIGQARGMRALVDALGADDVYVRQGAAAALEGPAGELFGYDPRASAEENREALGKWRAWGAAKFGRAWEE
ncbi:MAG TPA: HEAT repeat domain-containing protein [Planctomycetota bacterium]|nr:HEAT repeat domain-containing protein [Planctomycetota bacterium]